MKNMLIAATIAAALTGCAERSSPEVNARHYVLTGMESHDANLAVNHAESIKLMLPAFEEVYRAGKADRASGVTQVQALDNAKLLSESVIPSDSVKVIYGNHPLQSFGSYLSPREAHLLGLALSRTYFDGYEGK